METHIFTVYDSAAGFFLEPFFAPSVEFAIRGFRGAVNDEGHQFNKYPADYTLFVIGQYFGDSGLIVPCDAVSLGVGVTLLDRMEIEA